MLPDYTAASAEAEITMLPSLILNLAPFVELPPPDS